MAKSALSAAGVVRFGLAEDYANTLMAPTLIRFAQVFPLAEVELVFAPSPKLLRHLSADKLNLALVTRDPRQPFAVLRHERFVWARRRACRRCPILT